MFPLSVPKFVGRAMLAAAALTVSVSAPLLAQVSDASMVVTVPSAHAPLLVTQPVDLSKYELMESGPAPDAERLKDLGPAPADMRLTLQLALRRSDEQQKALDRFKQHAGTPGDSGFGATMTPAEFASAFGLAASDLDALRNNLRDAGFTLGNVDNGRLTINFSGTVEQVNAALLTSIHLYEDANGVEHYGPVDGWSAPEALMPAIAGIAGLDNFSVPALRSFNGPVVDFAAGATGKLASSSAWPKIALAARLEGELPHDVSFTASRMSMLFGDTTRLNIRIGGGDAPATGSLRITDQAGAKIAYIADITACESYNDGKGRSCTLDYTPGGAGRTVLNALYSGDENYRAVMQSEVIAHAGTGASVTVLSYSPVEYLSGSTAGTIYTSISWLGAGAQPTGTIVVESNMTPADTFGTITLPAAGASTIASGTACTTVPLGGYACTYGCTGSLTSQYISCTISNANLYANDAGLQVNEQQAVYSGDTTYASSTGTTDIYKVASTATVTPTISATAPTQTFTYGAATTANNTVTITGNATQGALYTAALVPFVETTNPQLGTMGEAAALSCTSATGVCAFANSFTVPANANPPSYTVTYWYSGKGGGSGTGYLSNSTTGTITIAQQAPAATMTLPKGTGGSQESDTYGALIAFTATGSLAWTGTGAAPTASDVSFTSTAPGSFGTTTCTGTATPYSCSALFTPTANDAVNTYAINLSFAGDTNYSGTVSGQTQNYSINPATPTLVLTPGPVSSTYGSTTPITITATATGVTGGTTPGGLVTFTTKAAVLGTLSSNTCTLSGGVCTVTYTPSATQAVATIAKAFSAIEAADGNYTASAAAPRDLITGQQTPTVAIASVTPASVVYGSRTVSTVTTTITYTGGGTAPTGSPTFTNTAAGAFGTVSCGAPSGDVITCTVTFTPTTGAAVGTYTIVASYAGDTDYDAASSTATNNYAITAATPALSWSPSPVVATYGVTTPITITVTSTGVTGGSTPGGLVTFAEKANGTVLGTLSSNTCTLSGGTCSVTYTPSALQAVATIANAFSANEAASGNYGASNTPTPNLKTIKQTPVLAISNVAPASVVYGSGTASTVTATLTYAGSGTAPTGSPTFTNTAAGSFGTVNCGAPSSDVITCTVTFTPTVTAVGTYTIAGSYIGDTEYDAVSSAQTGNYSITQATSSLTLAAATTQGGATACGSATSGVTACVLTATMGPAISGAMVTFNDTSTGAMLGTATTTAGVAALSISTATTGIAGGLNNFTATVTGTTNYTSATSAAGPIAYFQGILFSYVGIHNFSGLLTGAADPYSCCTAGVEGTVDGTAGPAYGVSVFNFTGSSQTLPVSFTNSTSKAFSLSNQCGATLSAGELCTLIFNYAPPPGDGCTPALPATGGSCTLDSSGYPQGTFESATWSYTLPNGVIAGLGNSSFSVSGVAAATGTLEGKALLQPLSLNISPLAAAFGTVAQNVASQTLTLVVTNSNATAVPFTYTAPSSGNFTANNTCSSPLAANASCNIYLTMVTTNTGAFTDSLTLSPTGGAASTVSISGTVAAANTAITLSSNNHNFGSISDGTSVAFSTTLTNDTASAATLSFSSSAGAGYTTQTNCGASLAASASCTYGFTFSPTTPGASSDTLTITSNVPILPGSGGDTATVTLSGTGVTGGHLTATSVTHNWGSLAVGTSGGNYGVEITNSTSSAVTLSFSGLTGSASGFSLVGSSCGASLAVNANCELIFSFTPTATGFVTGTYPITSSSPLYAGGSQVNPSQITLKGTGD